MRHLASCASALFLGLFATGTLAQNIIHPTPIGEPASKVYRQVLPDGRIIYSDKPVKGAKLDDTLTPDPETNGKLWRSESGKRPALPPRVEHTPVVKVPSVSPSGRRKTYDEAEADVIKAEMLLEDARRREQASMEAAPGERTIAQQGNSGPNGQHNMRPKTLTLEVSQAEAMLNRARQERDALRPSR